MPGGVELGRCSAGGERRAGERFDWADVRSRCVLLYTKKHRWDLTGVAHGTMPDPHGGPLAIFEVLLGVGKEGEGKRERDRQREREREREPLLHHRTRL